jgi:hypothetical protein
MAARESGTHWLDGLTAAQIQDINDAVKLSPPDAKTKQEIAALTGRSLRTVQSWFASGPNGRNFIPKSYATVKPARAELDVKDEGNARILAAVVLTGGINEENFTGRGKVFQETRESFTSVVEKLMDIQTDRFKTLFLEDFTASYNGSFWVMDYSTRRPLDDESDAFQALADLLKDPDDVDEDELDFDSEIPE